MERSLFLILLLVPFMGNAQLENDSVSFENKMHQHWMYNERMSYGVYPEIQFIQSPVVGLSASVAKCTRGEGAETSRGANVGFDLAPFQQFYGPKVSVWADVFALFLPANGAINLMYYFQENRSGLYLRPEIGVGIPRLHLKYGYGFKLVGDAIDGFQRHTLTLGYHFTIREKFL